MQLTHTKPNSTISLNRKARFNYEIEESFEAGLVLHGSEVKSLRLGKANIQDAFVEERGNELFLLNCYIAEYKGANRFNHLPERPRKLLLRRKDINKLLGKIKIKGYSVVALKLYFNRKNIAKIELGLGKGKKLHDKRQTIKERDWQRNKARIMHDK